MFQNYSMAGSGLAVLLINIVLELLGIDASSLTPGSVDRVVQAGIVIGAFILTVVGQVRRKDLKYGLIRKDVVE